jgi:diaminopimelate decarboxylase/aspartate kinase
VTKSEATGSPWVVLKFGGTSVSTAANWRNIADVLRKRLVAGLRPVIVHSALSGVTDKLEALLAAALRGSHAPVLDDIEHRHAALARELGVNAGPDFQRCLEELRQVAAGIVLVGEISDRTRARVLAAGELLATLLGAQYLRAQGFDVTWLDARTALRAESRRGAASRHNVLSVTCHFEPDPALPAKLAGPAGVTLTQGFIASDAEGDTCLLGRGGSDTSAAYFAAKLQAQRLEIWTDVPGLFSANPRLTPTARLLKSLHYDEAQEIATNGAKVLHPRCILPVRQYGIPLHVYATQTPELEGTVISASPGDSAAQVKAIAIRKGITLVSMESPGMWHQVGFLADAFQVFKAHGLSVDLVSTSETNVTVSLDPAANTLVPRVLEDLVADLGRLCRVQVIGPCASLSLLGRNIRGILHKLGDAFEIFEEQKIHLVTQAANDLNFTFVIDEGQGDRLVHQLHDRLIRATANDQVMGPTWEQLYAPPRTAASTETPAWWRARREELLQLASRHPAAFVYDGATLDARIRDLHGLRAISRVLYAMKANPHPQILQRIAAQGMSLECVSQGELERVREVLPGLPPDRILFTPNFAPRGEYEFGLQAGVRLTLDNLHPLREWPSLFAGREILVRIDTGYGRGHHDHVRTAGVQSKFGVPLADVPELDERARRIGLKIVGLHAHSGSGIVGIHNWPEVVVQLASLAQRFPDVRVLDIGGGLGVPERPGEPRIDLAALDEALCLANAGSNPFELWLEPGRFLVAECGVLLARVTQLKGKGEFQYVGVTTGMNSLIRPALYGAHHEIVNLSRLDQAPTETYNVVGPICESADQLGNERRLPPTYEGDVLLIANAGAYGRAMSSHYNLRAPAPEFFL